MCIYNKKSVYVYICVCKVILINILVLQLGPPNKNSWLRPCASNSSLNVKSIRWFPSSLIWNGFFVLHSDRSVRAAASMLSARFVKNFAANMQPGLRFWFSKSKVSTSCSERDRRLQSLVNESMSLLFS